MEEGGVRPWKQGEGGWSPWEKRESFRKEIVRTGMRMTARVGELENSLYSKLGIRE